jgi:hypothetical protein
MPARSADTRLRQAEGGVRRAAGLSLCNQDWPNQEPGETDWYDARLGGRTKLWRDDYYMIPFGLLQPPVLVGAG